MKFKQTESDGLTDKQTYMQTVGQKWTSMP